MENGVHEVEELKPKVEEFDKDGNNNGDVESVSATVEVEDENGVDLQLDGSLNEGEAVNDDDDDSIETCETHIVMEKEPVETVDSVEEVISLKVNDRESTSGKMTTDQPVVIENNEPVEFEEAEGKLLNFVEVNEERDTSDSATSNQPSGFEANEAMNDGINEAKVVNTVVQAIDGESTSDKGAHDETSELVTDESAVGDKDEVKMDISRDGPNVLENNGINEVGKVSNADVLEDGHEVNKKPVTLVLETSENGVSDHVDLEQALVHEDGVNGDSCSNIQPDGEIGVEENGDVNEKNTLVTESKNDDSYKGKEKLETSSNNLLNGSTVEQVQDDQKVKEESTSIIDEPDNRVESTVIPEVEKSKPKTHEVKQDIIESKPVIGLSLSKHDSKSNQSPVPNSKPTPAPAPAPTPVPSPSSASTSPAGLGSGAPLLETAQRVVQSRVPNSNPTTAPAPAPAPSSESTRPAGLGTGAPLLEPAQCVVQSPIPNSNPTTAPTPVPAQPSASTRPTGLGTGPPLLEPAQRVVQSPIPNSNPTTAPTLVPAQPSASTRPAGLGTGAPLLEPAQRVVQSPIPNSNPTTAPTPVLAQPSASTRPAGLGTGAPLLEPAQRVVRSQPNRTGSPLQNQVIEEPTNGEPDENDDTREKLQMIRVKFLRLARRLGQTPHNVVVAQVLYRLGLAEQLRGSNGGRVAAFSFERASAMSEQLEAAGQEPLEFSCTIMVLGKTGVGKSATINSIFDEVKFGTDPFQPGTKKVQDVVGTVQGIKVRVIDTPGLLPSWADRRKNEKILHSVKRFIQKSPPDIVLYLDRLDMQSRDSGDMHILRTITDVFGQSIWFNAIVVLTHAASAPPDGPNGAPTVYDMYVTQRSHVVQQAIRQAAGDMRLMNPVSLVENHSACRTNPAGQRVLPNAQVWKPHLLLLSFASKILVEANMLLKLQDSPPGKPFAARTRAPPLPFILSNLLHSRPQLKLPQDQFGDDDDVVGDDVTDESDDDESSEYDELPPFKRLTRSQLSKLSKAQKKSYYDELEYREKLFLMKQLKDEKKRRKMMKKMADIINNDNTNNNNNNVGEESNGAATVPVAVQDMTLPVSFDADNPTHRYRALDSANQWLTRPVLDPHGWDHDVGYDGINVEHLLTLQDRIPVSFTGQITKDKKDANLQMEVSTALKHGKSNSTTVAFDMQTVGKEMSYTLRSDTRFINYRKNKASAGLSGTYFGDSLTGGVKFEDKLMINKRGQLVVAGGAVIGRGDVAYGGSLEATLRDKDYPLGRFLSTVGLSVLDWHGDLALGWNAQSQIPIGRFTNLIGRVNLNNKGSGQVSVRLNSSEQLQIALAALVPVFCKLLGYYQDRDSAY